MLLSLVYRSSHRLSLLCYCHRYRCPSCVRFPFQPFLLYCFLFNWHFLPQIPGTWVPPNSPLRIVFVQNVFHHTSTFNYVINELIALIAYHGTCWLCYVTIHHSFAYCILTTHVIMILMWWKRLLQDHMILITYHHTHRIYIHHIIYSPHFIFISHWN